MTNLVHAALAATAMLALTGPLAVSAQTTVRQARAPARDPDVAEARIRPIAVAKWSALAVSVGAAAFGYRENRRADARYEDLDRLCQAQPARCAPRTPTGAYVDRVLESKFDEVRRLDHRATVGLVGAELGVAATVALFLLDLRHEARKPPDIPYTPPKLQLERTRVGALELSVRLSAP